MFWIIWIIILNLKGIEMGRALLPSGSFSDGQAIAVSWKLRRGRDLNACAVTCCLSWYMLAADQPLKQSWGLNLDTGGGLWVF